MPIQHWYAAGQVIERDPRTALDDEGGEPPAGAGTPDQIDRPHTEIPTAGVGQLVIDDARDGGECRVSAPGPVAPWQAGQHGDVLHQAGTIRRSQVPARREHR
jgi:hypothetical protein